MSNAQSPDLGLGYQLLRRAMLNPERRALSFEGHTRRYRELANSVRSLALALKLGGVCRGDRVAYIGLNHPAFLETLFACASIGAIFVPLNFRLTGPEIAYIVNDAGVHTLLADSDTLELVEGARQQLCVRRYISVETSEADAPASWESLCSVYCEEYASFECERVEEDEVAFIMYTSGTTGLPKGAMITHGNLFWNNMNVVMGESTMGTVTLTCAPLFHIGGLNVTTLSSLVRGLEVVLHRSFDPGLVLRDIEAYKVNCMFGAPTMFLMMSQHEHFSSSDLSSINALICGGAPVPVPLIETYGKRNVNFSQGYGLTETAPLACILESDLSASNVGSAGLPPMFTDVRVVDESNQALPAGEAGEVCIKGPNVMKGYWNRPEATREAFDDQGWFHSGDVGYIDSQGFLYLCDRVKDMVISGGENVYPAEVESVLYDHEAIKEVAVIGLPDEKWGETVTAIVVLNEGASLTLESLRDFAGNSLARFKLPSQLELLDILPRNPAGKVLKYRLKEQFSK